jgi:hypothetical protein
VEDPPASNDADSKVEALESQSQASAGLANGPDVDGGNSREEDQQSKRERPLLHNDYEFDALPLFLRQRAEKRLADVITKCKELGLDCRNLEKFGPRELLVKEDFERAGFELGPSAIQLMMDMGSLVEVGKGAFKLGQEAGTLEGEIDCESTVVSGESGPEGAGQQRSAGDAEMRGSDPEAESTAQQDLGDRDEMDIDSSVLMDSTREEGRALESSAAVDSTREEGYGMDIDSSVPAVDSTGEEGSGLNSSDAMDGAEVTFLFAEMEVHDPDVEMELESSQSLGRLDTDAGYARSLGFGLSPEEIGDAMNAEAIFRAQYGP